MDISLHLHDPDELKAFARFCNDMADVRVKQRGMAQYEQAAGRQIRSTPSVDGPATMAARELIERTEQQVAALTAAAPMPPAATIHNFDAPLAPTAAQVFPSVGFDTAALAEDAAKLFGLGMNPMTGQPVGATPPAVPLPPSSAPSTAGVAASSTVPAVLPAGQVLAFPLPAPQSAPSVAAPTAVGTTSPAGGVEIDADGLPWDHRIHSSSKEKNKDGRWRSKRGLNDEGLVKRIEAELRATMAIPAPSVPVPPVMAQIPAPPTAVPLPPPAATTDPTDFASLIAVLTPRLTPDRMPKIFEIVQSFGLPGLPALQQRPDLVPAVWAKLKEHLG